jgi:hypothetical protein
MLTSSFSVKSGARIARRSTAFSSATVGSPNPRAPLPFAVQPLRRRGGPSPNARSAARCGRIRPVNGKRCKARCRRAGTCGALLCTVRDGPEAIPLPRPERFSIARRSAPSGASARARTERARPAHATDHRRQGTSTRHAHEHERRQGRPRFEAGPRLPSPPSPRPSPPAPGSTRCPMARGERGILVVRPPTPST